MRMQKHSTRLLIVEQDEAFGRQMVEVLGPCRDQAVDPARDCSQGGMAAAGACRSRQDGVSCCYLLHSLRQLHKFDMSLPDTVICSANLPDGSGLDALAYVRGIRPDLSVVVTGLPGDAELAVEAIRAGAADFLVTADLDLRTLRLAVDKCLAHQRIKKENERLQAELSRSAADLALKNHQLQSVIRQLELMTRTDDLTGLANRRWLNLMLEGHWAEACRNDLPLACMMIDLDGLKRFNDRFGHQRGDEILHLAGTVIQANCRTVDITARYGGDEFCVLMPHTEAAEAVKVAQRVLREFEIAVGRLPKNEPNVSLSLGISQIDLSRPVDANQLINHADEALYAAKSAGKARAVLRLRDGVKSVPNEQQAPFA
ncbi:MAG: diguanylate cyclase [Phycisphaerales bacterium]|nr:MAG: diguanylate cyclase [Phycisphaerales bacterium]